MMSKGLKERGGDLEESDYSVHSEESDRTPDEDERPTRIQPQRKRKVTWTTTTNETNVKPTHNDRTHNEQDYPTTKQRKRHTTETTTTKETNVKRTHNDRTHNEQDDAKQGDNYRNDDDDDDYPTTKQRKRQTTERTTTKETNVKPTHNYPTENEQPSSTEILEFVNK